MGENKDLEMNIGNPILADCMVCQTQEGREEFGQSSPKALPLDCYQVTSRFLDQEESVNNPELPMCSDCLLYAVKSGVHVKRHGEYWDGSNSMFIRNTDAKAINEMFKKAKERRGEIN